MTARIKPKKDAVKEELFNLLTTKMTARIVTEEEEIKFHLKELKKALRKGFGPKCKDRSLLCGCCIAWRNLEDLSEMFKLTND